MDLRPGFRAPYKGNPQQGTLFHARAKELDPTGQRYPRGYTPERQAEVREAVGDVGYSSFGISRSYHGDAAPPALISEAEFGDMGPDEKRNWGEGRAVIHNAVARSTVPTDVVERTRFGVTPNIGHNGLYLPGNETLLFGRDAKDAQDHREGFGSGYPTPEVQRLNQGQTVIHELGHAADPALDPLRGKRNVLIDRGVELPVEGYTEPKDLGRAEEFADDFAEQHFRPDPRAGRRQTFDTATASYPGAAPDDIPPRHLAGYSKWRERSDRAAVDLRPRHEAADRAADKADVLAAESAPDEFSPPAPRYPKTGEQARAVNNLRDKEERMNPRLRV